MGIPPSGDQAHERCFVRHGMSRDQLRVRMVMDALRNAKRFHATVSLIADTGLKDAIDLGGSLFLFFGIMKLMDTGNPQVQPTSE